MESFIQRREKKEKEQRRLENKQELNEILNKGQNH